MDTSPLKTAYGALRDFLAEQQLYDDAPTGAFDRAQLARLFTAYYDAEAETLRGVSGAQTGAALDDVARSIGYDDYNQMASSGQTIIEDGKIRTGMIDVDNLEARRVRVSDASGNAVTILPGDGLKLLDNSEVTSTFSGVKIPSLEAKVPLNDNIILSEAVAGKLPINMRSSRVTLASGNVNTNGTPTVVEIPNFSVMFKATYREQITPFEKRFSWSGNMLDGPLILNNPYPLTISAKLLLNGVACARVSRTISQFMRRPLTTTEGTAYFLTADISQSQAMSQLVYTYAEPGPLTMELECSVSCTSRLVKGTWDLQVAARKVGTDIDQRPLMREPILVGGAVFNASFYGNGLMIARATNQYAGLAAPDNGDAELVVRSNQNGFRTDGSGQWRWCDKRQEWIPVDRVLYRGYVAPNGELLKMWRYDSPPNIMSVSRSGQGKFKITLPNPALRPMDDFVVKVEAWTDILNDKRQATVYYGENTNAFNITLSNTGFYDGYFYFEVVDVSDMRRYLVTRP